MLPEVIVVVVVVVEGKFVRRVFYKSISDAPPVLRALKQPALYATFELLPGARTTNV